MKLSGGMDALPSVSGLTFSIMFTSILIVYAYQKFEVLMNKKDAKIFSTDLIDSIAEKEVFDTTMGLKIAVAFVEWGDLSVNREPILDKSYGRIAFYREAYGYHANETFFYEYVELPSHYCTAEELNLEKSTER